MTPRPAILLTLAYGAGLATGLLRFGAPAGALLVLVATACVAAAVSGPLPVLLVVAVSLGRASSELAWVADGGSCAARLPAGRVRLTVRLHEPVPLEGGRLEVTPLGAGCTGAVAARWPAGDPRPAGITSRIEGTWIPRPGTAGRAGGMLAVAGGGPGRGSPTLPERAPHGRRATPVESSTAPARRWSTR